MPDDVMGFAKIRDEMLALLEKWSAKAKWYRDAHYSASVRLRRMHFGLGIPSVAFSAVVGTTVFATLQKTVSLNVAVTVGCLSVLAAILAALQTFLRFGERAESHRLVSAEYDAFAKRADFLGAAKFSKARPATAELIKKLEEATDQMLDRLTNVDSKAPELASSDQSAQEDSLPRVSSGPPAVVASPDV